MKSPNVPFLDLRRGFLNSRQKVEQALASVLAGGIYLLGPELEALEREFAAVFGIPYAAGVGSGTDALTLALEASGAIVPGVGEEVITSAMTAAFTALAICRAGAVPRFADIDP